MIFTSMLRFAHLASYLRYYRTIRHGRQVENSQRYVIFNVVYKFFRIRVLSQK